MHQHDLPTPAAHQPDETDTPITITATQVGDDDRSSFLPSCFGTVRTGQRQLPAYLFAENLIYTRLKQMSEDYHGDFWHFYHLSNGSAYMAPSTLRPMRIKAENGYQNTVSADAAGIVVTLAAYSDLLALWDDSSADVDTLAQAVHARFYGLRDFALAHAERDAILQLID